MKRIVIIAATVLLALAGDVSQFAKFERCMNVIGWEYSDQNCEDCMYKGLANICDEYTEFLIGEGYCREWAREKAEVEVLHKPVTPLYIAIEED